MHEEQDVQHEDEHFWFHGIFLTSTAQKTYATFKGQITVFTMLPESIHDLWPVGAGWATWRRRYIKDLL